MHTRVRVAGIYTNQIKSGHERGHEPQVYYPSLVQAITSLRPLPADENLIFYTEKAVSGLFRDWDK